MKLFIINITMNKNIDLTKILKNCPKGFELYSPMYGVVSIFQVYSSEYLPYPIRCIDCNGNYICFTKEGYYSIKCTDVECILFPSKEQRDWSKFTAPWYKKDKFDPNTLQPFDKVLVRDSGNKEWVCSFFSYRRNDHYSFACVNDIFVYCIPYNDDTKHLLCTNEEAPEYYRFWED